MIGSVYIADKDKKTGHATPFGQAVTGDTLAKTWIRLLENAGLDQKSYKWHELHFHTLRKFFKSECVNAGIKNQYIEFWMGHSGGYLDSSYFRESLKEHIAEYQKAISCLCIYEPATESEFERRKRQMRDTARLMDWSEEKRLQLEQLLIEAKYTKDLDSIPEKLKNIAEEKRRTLNAFTYMKGTAKQCKDNKNCQLVITEELLEDYLKRGFRFVATLPSGKILVSNED